MNQLKAKIEMVILKHFTKSSVHGLNNMVIAPKKVENVKALHNIKDENVWFIYDVTLFGSAKDGMVFTNRGIYWREVLESPKHLDYIEMIESTANQDLKANVIIILDKTGEIEIKESYYNLIAELRLEIVKSSMIYETYYRSGLQSVEESLIRFFEKGNFRQMIEWLNKYEGLFLRPKHKSVKIHEISFEAYLKEQLFSKAQGELDILKERNPVFYRNSLELLENALKEERYLGLEVERKNAMGSQDFEEAYILIEEQRALGLLSKDDLRQIELQTKDGHYKSLKETRLKAIEQEEYALAFSLLDRQIELKIRPDFKMERLRSAMVVSKNQALAKHLKTLNILLESGQFSEAEGTVEQIYKIDPSYPMAREKVLLTISNNNLKQAKEQILQIEDPVLKLELDGILNKTTKKLHDKIRTTARNKQYDIFTSRPDIWNYKDEYSMGALCYFALEADIDGLLKAVQQMDFLLIPANIFGHNFVDLIGFACDPSLGNKKGNPLEILEKLKTKVDLKKIHDRINYLKTGKEGYFISYKVSQEDRLAQLNEKLMSTGHFNHILRAIESPSNYDVDEIIKHIFTQELEALAIYPKKDEFETSRDYQKRCEDFKWRYSSRSDFIVEYKKQNQPMIESIAKRLEEQKGSYIPSISAMIEDKNKELEALRSMDSPEGMLALLDLYFPIKDEVIKVEIGTYDAEREVFLMMIDGKAQDLPMPISIAKQYKKTFPEVEYVRRREIKDGKAVVKAVTRYGAGM